MHSLTRRDFLARTSQAGIFGLASNFAIDATAQTTSKPRIKIGQIGTGHGHADGKLSALRRSADFEVVGVVEPDEGRRISAGANKTYQGLSWMTEEQLLNTPGLRAVAVETEVKDLLAVASGCVSAGMHIHLDKPAGSSLPAYRQLLANATRQKLTVQMGYMFRYNPGFQFCFQAARDGWLGRIFSIDTVIGKTVSPAARIDLARNPGGAMFELGCHVIDAVITLLGPPDRVTPHIRQSDQPPATLGDNMLAVLDYPHTTVTVRSALMDVAGEQRRQFVVCGDHGTVELRPLEPAACRLSLDQPRGTHQKGWQELSFPNLPRYDADLADLARVIRGEAEFAFTPAHDIAVQETILRASGLSLE